MRFSLAITAALALTLLAPVAPARAGDAPRELVVQLSAAAVESPGLAVRSVGALPTAVRRRFAALGLQATRTFAEQLEAGRQPLPDPYDFHPERIVLVEAPDTALAASALAALATDPLVDWVERNVTRHVVGRVGVSPRRRPTGPAATALDTLANDPYLRSGAQYALWNIGPAGMFGGLPGADIDALTAWRTSVGANDLKLAVADTGIDPAQPELGGLMPDGSPRIVDEFNATDSPNRTVLDYYGHGTPVTGIMAARTNDGAHLAPNTGIAGVCGGDGAGNAGCRIVPIKIAPDSSGDATTFDIARSLFHAADVGAAAINLSFAGVSPSRIERQALMYALLNGCVPVGAAGNSGQFPDEAVQALYPASYAQVGLAISVGATDSFDQRTLFSSYPPGLDVVAPGINIYTTFMTYPPASGAAIPPYVVFGGTSAAAPHVTGAVGLLAAVRPDLIDDDAQHVIRESADDVGAPGFDPQTAYGRLNVARMLARVGPGIGVWHDETAADSFTVEGQGLLTVGERGPGTLGRHFGTSLATRLAAYATVAIPDTFLSVTSVWLRVGGTFAVRGDFSVPYFAPTAEVLRRDATSITFRGFLYRVACDSCSDGDDAYVPLAPSNVRFGFTVIGVVDRPPTLHVNQPLSAGTPGDLLLVGWTVSDPDQVTRVRVTFEPDGGGSVFVGEAMGNAPGGGFTLPCLGPLETPGRLVVTAYDEHGHRDQTRVAQPFTLHAGACSAPLATFRATPSPFERSLAIFAPGAGELRVIDATGRVVRRLVTGGGDVDWDGHDEHGTASPAGVYWVRYEGAAGSTTRRVVKLGR